MFQLHSGSSHLFNNDLRTEELARRAMVLAARARRRPEFDSQSHVKVEEECGLQGALEATKSSTAIRKG